MLPDSPPNRYDVTVNALAPISFVAQGSQDEPPVGSINITASISFSAQATHNATSTGVVLASAVVVRAVGFQDFVASISPFTTQKFYTLTITDVGPLSDLNLPISSWQATSQAEPRQSYLQCVIPAATGLIEAISDRQNGTLVISEGYRFADGTVQSGEIIRSEFSGFNFDRGPTRQTATISGYRSGQQSEVSTSRKLTGIRSISMSNGRFRVRCSIDLFLRPGMSAILDDGDFMVSYITYYVNNSDSFCEVGER
jgi:hypothetical protein